MEVRRVGFTNQRAVGESKRCELIHALSFLQRNSLLCLWTAAVIVPQPVQP